MKSVHIVVRIQIKHGKIRSRKTPNRDTFLAVLSKCYLKISELRFFASLNPARGEWKVSDGRNLYQLHRLKITLNTLFRQPFQKKAITIIILNFRVRFHIHIYK